MPNIKELVDAIKNIVTTYTEEEKYYLSNEIATRDHLINPLLNVLGWNTTSPKFVRPNQRNELGDIPDYTLFKEGKETLVIEAKKAAIDVSDPKVIQQLSKYSYGMGIRAGIITNGMQWLLFDTFEQDPKERIIWVVDFENSLDNYATEADKLMMLIYAEIDILPNKMEDIKKNKLLNNFWQKNFSTKEQLTQFLTRKILLETKTAVTESTISTFVLDKLMILFPHSETKIEASTIKTPKILLKKNSVKEKRVVLNPKTNLKITFPDGTVFFNQHASQTFLQTIEKIGAQRVQTLGLKQGGIPLVDTTKKNENSSSLYATANGYWVNTSSSTKDKLSALNKIATAFSIALKIEQIQHSK